MGGGWWHLSLSPLAGGGEAEEAAAGQLEATSVTVSRPPPSLHHQHSPFPSNQLRVKFLEVPRGSLQAPEGPGGAGGRVGALGVGEGEGGRVGKRWLAPVTTPTATTKGKQTNNQTNL